MAQKIPPPPPIATNDPTFNRWLLELTNILNADGTLDPGNIPGLAGLTASVASLQTTVAAQTSEIIALQHTTNTQATQITGLLASVSALNSRSQVFNGAVDPASGLGNVGDWYANTAGAAGHRIFIKTAVATWTAFPF
jgi:hypothetical protein